MGSLRPSLNRQNEYVETAMGFGLCVIILSPLAGAGVFCEGVLQPVREVRLAARTVEEAIKSRLLRLFMLCLRAIWVALCLLYQVKVSFQE